MDTPLLKICPSNGILIEKLLAAPKYPPKHYNVDRQKVMYLATIGFLKPLCPEKASKAVTTS